MALLKTNEFWVALTKDKNIKVDHNGLAYAGKTSKKVVAQMVADGVHNAEKVHVIKATLSYKKVTIKGEK